MVPTEYIYVSVTIIIGQPQCFRFDLKIIFDMDQEDNLLKLGPVLVVPTKMIYDSQGVSDNWLVHHFCVVDQRFIRKNPWVLKFIMISSETL